MCLPRNLKKGEYIFKNTQGVGGGGGGGQSEREVEKERESERERERESCRLFKLHYINSSLSQSMSIPKRLYKIKKKTEVNNRENA